MSFHTGRPTKAPPDVTNRAQGIRVAGGGSRIPLPPGTSAPAGGGPFVPSKVVIPPWHDVRPPGARDFQGFGAVNVVGPAVLVTGASFQVPVGRVPVIRSLTFDVNNLAPTDTLAFRLLQDGSAVEGFAPISVFPRNASTISLAYGPDETYLILNEGALITITAELAAGGPLDVGASFHGWHVDTNAAEALTALYEGF